MYVKFKGDKRELARLAIIASVPGLEDVLIDKIYNPSYVPYWNHNGTAHTVGFFCFSNAIIHPNQSILPKPWAKVYPTALELVEAAGLEFVETLPYANWVTRVITERPLEI